MSRNTLFAKELVRRHREVRTKGAMLPFFISMDWTTGRVY